MCLSFAFETIASLGLNGCSLSVQLLGDCSSVWVKPRYTSSPVYQRFNCAHIYIYTIYVYTQHMELLIGNFFAVVMCCSYCLMHCSLSCPRGYYAHAGRSVNAAKLGVSYPIGGGGQPGSRFQRPKPSSRLKSPFGHRGRASGRAARQWIPTKKDRR